MNDESKIHEFWIEIGNDPSDCKEIYKRYSAAFPFKPIHNAKVIHFRKVNPRYDAAVEKLVKTLKELADVGIPKAKKALRTWKKMKK